MWWRMDTRAARVDSYLDCLLVLGRRITRKKRQTSSNWLALSNSQHHQHANPIEIWLPSACQSSFDDRNGLLSQSLSAAVFLPLSCSFSRHPIIVYTTQECVAKKRGRWEMCVCPRSLKGVVWNNKGSLGVRIFFSQRIQWGAGAEWSLVYSWGRESLSPKLKPVRGNVNSEEGEEEEKATHSQKATRMRYFECSWGDDAFLIVCAQMRESLNSKSQENIYIFRN